MTAIQVCDVIAGYRTRQKPIAFDIEGGIDWVTCYSIADSAHHAVVIPIIHADGSSVWNEDDELLIWEATQALLEDPQVPKIAQNALYDCFVLLWTYGIVVRGLQDDTMLKHWELYCELEKSLGFQASIYTREPFYKAERKSTDEMTQFVYCGKDSAVTFECNEALEKRLQPKQKEHYKTNMLLLAPLLFMEARGIRYDHAKAKKKLKTIQRHIYKLQDLLNRAACHKRQELACLLGGWGSNETAKVDEGKQSEQDLLNRAAAHKRESLLCVAGCGREEVEVEQCDGVGTSPFVQLLASTLCRAKPRRVREWDEVKTYKNGKPPRTVHKRISEPVEIRTLADCAEFALDSCQDAMRRVQVLCKRGNLGADERAELAGLLGIHVKVNSTGDSGDSCWFLYDVCGFEKQFQKEGNKLTDRLASDDEALIKIWVGESKKPQPWTATPLKLKHRGRLALAFLKLRRLITETKTLRVAPDPDGRMRCGYNVVGTETGRLTCYESPTGSGYNLQTVTKKHRTLFLADPGRKIAQRDLSGADGWTVASYAAMQGDRTMLDDYRAGLKPAKITARIYEDGPGINKLDRPTLKEQCKRVSQDGWLYAATKQVQHGSSYMMGKRTMSNNILTLSWKLSGKPIYVSEATCESIQRSFFVRYWGIPRWHDWARQTLKQSGCFITSDGFKRQFFGRKDDHDTLKQFLAHAPQYYTTKSTTMALLRLWTDPENRLADGSLREEPLHTVHDSLVTQFAEGDEEWSRQKGLEWFNNPLLIAQETITIPFEMGVGLNWKELT